MGFPRAAQSKAGKNFVSCTLKIKDGDEPGWLKILAFSEHLQDELMQLRGGDALSVSGNLKADIYTPEGHEPRVSMTVFAETVMPLRATPKPKKPQNVSPDRQFDDGFPESWGGPEQ